MEIRKEDIIITKAIEIYNREGGKEGTFEMLDYEASHSYCIKAEEELKNSPKIENNLPIGCIDGQRKESVS